MRAAAPWLVGFVVGCSEGEAPPEAVAEPTADEAIAQAEAQAQAAPPPAPTPVAATGDAPEVLLVWDNVGDLYQSFFSHTGPVTQLATDLAGHANGPVNVHVRWDQEQFLGTIRLRILPGTLLRPPVGEGTVVPLQQLAPMTTALATYRSDVASRFDVRVASFKVALESFSGARHCVFGVAGKPPPDGRLVSPCVLLNGQERCGTPETDGVRFSAELAADIRACLQPSG